MPRKPVVKKQKIAILVKGTPITVTMTPPTGVRSSWFAYWTGLVTSKSTGHADLGEAVKAVEDMLRNGGKKSSVANTVVSDEEFEEIQRRHYSKKTDPIARTRSQKSLRECLDAISAFRELSGVKPIALATPDDCERFQRKALEQSRNWRVQYADNDRSRMRRKKQGPTGKLSPNTVLKWSVALQAAFQRVCRNAGKKCVRGVVHESKLLTENPWTNFTWIEGSEKKLRQFDHGELLSLLDFFGTKWSGVAVAPAFLKVMLWSWSRRIEVSSLRWSDERRIGSECHFETTGKWNVTKWFRLPDGVRRELELLRTESEFVFGCYSAQLRDFYEKGGDNRNSKRVSHVFNPENLGDWMYRQVHEWSITQPKGAAYLHVFRKTALQHALSGEHIQETVAAEARISPAVMRASYARPSDDEFRRMSNGTFDRIRRSLPVEVAVRYGCDDKPVDRLAEKLDLARKQGEWEAVAHLASELAQLGQASG